MAYAQTKDAIDFYGDTFILTSVSRDYSTSDAPLDKALQSASDEMDTYIGAQYTVPLSPVPSVVVRFCVDMAIYIASVDAGVLTDEKTARYNAAVSWLKQIAKGDAVIPGMEEDAVNESHRPQISGPDRIFSRTKMWGL